MVNLEDTCLLSFPNLETYPRANVVVRARSSIFHSWPSEWVPGSGELSLSDGKGLSLVSFAARSGHP